MTFKLKTLSWILNSLQIYLNFKWSFYFSITRECNLKDNYFLLNISTKDNTLKNVLKFEIISEKVWVINNFIYHTSLWIPLWQFLTTIQTFYNKFHCHSSHVQNVKKKYFRQTIGDTNFNRNCSDRNLAISNSLSINLLPFLYG